MNNYRAGANTRMALCVAVMLCATLAPADAPRFGRILMFGAPARAEAAAVPQGGQFSLVSLNTLHLGWGTTNPAHFDPVNGQTKINSISALMNGVPVGLLQEVMPQANPAYFVFCQPATCVIRTSQPYGLGWYKETYLFFVEANYNPAGFDSAGMTGTFSRPPSYIRFRPPNAAQDVYIANFHAIWGLTNAQRLAEAAAIRTTFIAGNNLQNVPLIVGGDWNVTAADVEQQIGCNNCVTPAVLTSLTPAGALSSSYDHFLFSPNIACNNAHVMQLPFNLSYATWRAVVSDHLPIQCTVVYQ